MDLQMENQLLKGNQAALGSPFWSSITLSNDILYSRIKQHDILYFILVSWISKWRTNWIRGTKQL